MNPSRQEMTFEEYLDIPKTLGWKHEYFGGALHRSPAWTAVASYRAPLHDLLAREIYRREDSERRLATLSLRPPVNDDLTPLLTLFCECFDQAIEYAGCRENDLIQYAHRSLDCFFRETPSIYLDACRVAIVNERIVAAAMIANFEHGAILQPIFVAEKYRSLGLATQLLTASAKSLMEHEVTELHSRCNLGNEASTVWHLKCGFIEVPEQWSAGHRANIYFMEAERQERLNLPTAKETKALAEFWAKERHRLER